MLKLLAGKKKKHARTKAASMELLFAAAFYACKALHLIYIKRRLQASNTLFKLSVMHR
jgi:hypothetical protein